MRGSGFASASSGEKIGLQRLVVDLDPSSRPRRPSPRRPPRRRRRGRRRSAPGRGTARARPASTGRMPNGIGMAAPVSTATTPGSASASRRVDARGCARARRGCGAASRTASAAASGRRRTASRRSPSPCRRPCGASGRSCRYGFRAAVAVRATGHLAAAAGASAARRRRPGSLPGIGGTGSPRSAAAARSTASKILR